MTSITFLWLMKRQRTKGEQRIRQLGFSSYQCDVINKKPIMKGFLNLWSLVVYKSQLQLQVLCGLLFDSIFHVCIMYSSKFAFLSLLLHGSMDLHCFTVWVNSN